MNSASWLLLADGTLHSKFELGRIQNNSDWILPIGACLALLVFVRVMYRRDAAELWPLWSWLLTLLRAATFLGLLFLFLQPQWRTEAEITHNSRVALLVDTSLSMGLDDRDAGAAAGAPRRIEQVAAGLAKSGFLTQLRKTHDVAVYKFNNGLDRDLLSLGKLPPQPEPAEDGAAAVPALPAPAEKHLPHTTKDWRKFLTPAGTETRLGEALQQLLHQERGTALAGVVLLSDGGLNAGAGPETAVELAREAKGPVFTVGLGSKKKPTSVRVNDLAAPVRAFPGDRYPVTGYLQAQGLPRKTAIVQLLSRDLDAAGDRSRRGTGQVEGSQQVILGGDGEITPVRFELTPKKDEVGRRILCLRIQVEGVRASADMIREADIEIVDHRNRVLLLAGGPTREYQFVRTLLYRDRFTTVDVLLQTAQEGVSQEANKMLAEFPSTREAMAAYDCVVAFDPNWQALTPVQIDVLHDWVDGQGGGLIAIAGPVYAGKGIDSWLQDPAMAKIRNLYPVEFLRQFAPGVDFAYTAKDPWPLNFSREGQQADFLWLGEGVTASQQAWGSFTGVFSFFPVHNPKPAATVLATYSDPRAAAEEGKEPPYLVEQFYGSGRVFYMGSGEMWRLRRLDPDFFDQFYTKLIRHVSQGRLLRGSSRGVLLPGQDSYLLGNTVEVRAQLTNARLTPLGDKSVPLEVLPPSGAVQTVTLAADPVHPGGYSGQFAVLEEGAYRLELPLPESQNERLTRRIQVKVPELERENPQLHDALLQRIADGTGGNYFAGFPAVLGQGGKKSTQPLVNLLRDHTNVDRATVAPDPRWEETWLRWLMIGLCSLLCLEWLIRRLCKLA